MKLPKIAVADRIATSLNSLIAVSATSDPVPVITVMVQAFSADPVVRWAWPDLPRYISHFPSFVEIFGGKAFAQGSAYCTDGYAGAALWLPPNIHPDEKRLNNLLQRTVPEQRQGDLFAMFEAMDSYHPSEPHWYLPLIGVDPFQQSRGYGSALMQHALIQCDRDQIPAYLESTSIHSVSFYQQHGFELLGTIQEGTSPPLFPMLRKPQPIA